jgi:hypothetical protein
VAGIEDNPSSAESTEELPPVEEQPKEARQVKWQARELPTDEELLRKMDEGSRPASNQAGKETLVAQRVGTENERVGSGGPSVGKQHPGSEEKVGAVQFVGGQGGVEAVRMGKASDLHGATVSMAISCRSETGAPSVGRDDNKSSTKVEAGAATLAVPAPIDARASPPAEHESMAGPPHNPGISSEAAALPPSSAKAISSNNSRPAELVLGPGVAASESAQEVGSASLSLPTPAPAAEIKPAGVQIPPRQSTAMPSRPHQQAPVPVHEQQPVEAAREQGPEQAGPKQVPSRAADGPAPQAPASGSSRGGAAHQGAREDESVVWLNGKRYQKLKCVGKGGSSRVYKVGVLLRRS